MTRRSKQSKASNASYSTKHLILDDENTVSGAMPQEYRRARRTLETVQILQSSTIQSIPHEAFRGFTALQSVRMDDGVIVTEIENYAFHGCTRLESIEIPDGVTTIGVSAFWGCTGLESIKIPDGVTTIGEDAFRDCTGLESIKIPDGVTTIGGGAFRDCTGLKSIKIPDGVTTIGGAFSGCTGLESIKIPDGVTTIGECAFSGCTALKSIEIPDSMTTIGRFAFSNCDALEQRITNGTNYHTDTQTWLGQRFLNLPIHRACYHANNSPQSLHALSSLVQQNKQTLATTDAMGMTPLHILCCKTNVNLEVVQVVVEGNPSVLTQTDVTNCTPFQQFLQSRNLLEAGQGIITMPSLCDLLENGMRGEDLDILLVLDSNQEINLSSQDETTGLLPFMSAAALSTCALDLVYTMAMNTNLVGSTIF